MAIRPHPTKGPGWWQVVISQGRNKPQKTYICQGTRAQALTFEAELRGIPQEVTDQRPADILGQFLDHYRLNSAERTAKDAETTLPRLIKALGNKPLALYRQQDYNKYKQLRHDQNVSRKTVNIELGYWRALLGYARDQLKAPIGELPKLYTKKQTRPPDKQPLTADETARLLGELKGDKKTIAMLYAYCGLRRDEALYLKRSMIDLDRGIIHVRGKGDKGRIVPIIGAELIQRLKEDCKGKKPDDYMWICKRTKKPYTNIKKGIKAAAERAGITKPIHNHLLRHSAATNAIVAGVGIRALQAILGHSDIRMTEIYTTMAADLIMTESQKMANLHQAATSEMSERKKRQKGKVIPLHPRQPS